MNQYCRYCVYLYTGNGIWCDFKQKEITERYAKHTNHCKDFAFCKEDAFMENERGYIPRHNTTQKIVKKKKDCDGQMCLSFVEENNKSK